MVEGFEPIWHQAQCCMHELVQAPWPQLERLSLSGCQLTSEGVAELASAHWAQLRELDMSDNALRAEAMAALPPFPNYIR